MGVGAGPRQELADKIRHRHRKDMQRQRMVLAIIVTIGVLLSAGALVWLQLRPSSGETVTPHNATADYGFTLTSEHITDAQGSVENPVEIKIYEDFLCALCKDFHEESGTFLYEQLSAGNVTLTFHPIAHLVAESTDEYSERASNAAVCVADRAGIVSYFQMHSLLMENQPAQNGAGLTDEQLIDFGAQAGAGDISECVHDRTFDPWLQEAIVEAKRMDVTGTPTVRVNGANVVREDDGKKSIPGPAELEFVLNEGSHD
ncbi:MAG: DsbA family protein [Gulosibacter sp.]|uniref:DsbA family protein n=1 Tax=Gulosibacter sp. TaxID=2817531 RepID=UPI003F920B7B